MASKKKTETVDASEVEETSVKSAPVKPAPAKQSQIKTTIQPKFEVGDIVFVSKEADTDLEGFKLFPEYKKCAYTVEAYDQNTDVYSLRRLNLLLHLKGEFILSPEEKETHSLFRRQF